MLSRSACLLSLLLAPGLMPACERGVAFPASGSTWDAPEVPAFSALERLVTTNNGDDTFSFVSTDSVAAPRLLGQVVVGESPIEPEGPHHLAVSPDGRSLYYNLSNFVPSSGSGPHGAHGTGDVPGFLVKLDARTYRPLGRAVVDRSPGDVILSADGRRVFVSHYDLKRFSEQLMRGRPAEEGESTVAIIDAESMQILSLGRVCPTAHGQGLSPDQATLYVTCSLTDELAILDVRDPSRPRVMARVAVGPAAGPPGLPHYSPYALIVHPRDGTVWVSCTVSGEVRVFDPVQGKFDEGRAVKLGGAPMFAAWGEDLATLHVARQKDDRLAAIEVATGKVRELALPRERCENAHAVALLPGRNGAAVVCEGDHRSRRGSVVFVDLMHFALGGHLELGLYPDSITLLSPLPL